MIVSKAQRHVFALVDDDQPDLGLVIRLLLLEPKTYWLPLLSVTIHVFVLL
jgi:hypothetical protein